MKFCTQCGMELSANEVHNCAAQSQPTGMTVEKATAETSNQEMVHTETPTSTRAAASSGAALATAKEQLSKIDGNKIWSLLKNPMSALQLRAEHDLMYGILGIVASLIGFILWAWSFKHALISMVMNQLRGLFGSSGSYNSASEYFTIVGHMFILGLVSLVVLLGAAYLAGNKMGTQRLNWKDALVKLGGLQWISGAAFIVAAVVMFVSIKFSFILMLVTLLTTLVMTVYAGIEVFRITRERAVWFMAIVVLVHLIAVLIVFNAFGAELMSGLQDLFD